MLSRPLVHWTTRVVDLVAPAHCVVCDGSLAASRSVCPPCASALGPPTTCRRRLPGADIVTAGPYVGPLSEAIRRFKYGGRADLATPLARLLARVLRDAAGVRDAGAVVDTIVPVPLHPRRLAERGYNQATLLARALGPLVDLPTAPRALRRVRHTPRQATLDRAHRLANARGSVAPRDPLRLAGRRVLVLDDVVTTGATLRACAEAIHDSGGRIALVAALADAGGGDGDGARPAEIRHFRSAER